MTNRKHTPAKGGTQDGQADDSGWNSPLGGGNQNGPEGGASPTEASGPADRGDRADGRRQSSPAGNRGQDRQSGDRSQGGQANKTGSVLESQVQNIFVQYGFTIMPYKEYQKSIPLFDNLVIKNYPYQSIYGHKAKSEFLALSASRGLRAH